MANIVRPLPDLALAPDYYCEPRIVDGRPTTIYEIWEKGGAYADSITPSTYSPDYRHHIVDKVVAWTKRGSTVFSLGCGNGFVEAELIGHCRKVRAMDRNDEAVRLCAAKGVQAVRMEFFDLSAADLSDVDLIYADGLLGHLFRLPDGLAAFADKLRSVALRPGTVVAISNDAPRDRSAAFSPHDRLDDFWFLSKSYLAAALTAADLLVQESYYFPYTRPLSGLRLRAICIARAA
jgi:SAM-dependent methyltransferase